jgi:prepilin-type N-terminal cleavage/methylation domain-containing protein
MIPLTAHTTRQERGFTLLEMLVAMTLSSIVLTIVIGSALMFRDTYSHDIVRTRIHGNLRSAMDIISMNIRQAGENLMSTFPAVLLTNGSSGAGDVLTLRRALAPEVLTLCSNAAIGATAIAVSSGSLSNSECVVANVTPLLAVFESLRSDAGGTLRMYMYDSTTKNGEYISYTGYTTVSGQYLLSISGITQPFTQLNTALYVIEEYQFQLDSADAQLDLYIDGYSAAPRPVAFDVTNFQVTLDMQDGSVATSLAANSASDWKDISQIRLTLTGSSTYKGRVTTSSISAEFFPRNVLSYEG